MIFNRKKILRYSFIFLILFVGLFFLISYLSDKFSHKKVVYVLKLEGEINSDKIDLNLLRDIIYNSNYDGLILYINSPGGDLTILDILDIFKQNKKPSVCYIDSQATSAAYWLCSQANYIIAKPSSIVGNIGAYIMKTDISGLLKKLGINVTIIQSTRYKTMLSIFTPLNEDEYDYLRYLVDEVSNMFVNDVLSKRNITNESLALSGLFFISYDAKKLGLIDSIGFYSDAKKEIAKLLNISESDISFKEIDISRKPVLFYGLFSMALNYILEKFLWFSNQIRI